MPKRVPRAERRAEPPRGARASRAADKLAAAIDAFGLASRVRGATAVDVGASTGGFTGVLLRAGAARVFAVDVGHGQLRPELRGDPRVESRERTDWRRLPLHELPGPFDFFTVDVSFVAARNMLRSLAFRLRPGAEGVVLVKPQYELPKRRASAARGDHPELRAEALARVAAKAAELGFTLVAQRDSPVRGASGTLEVLAHLRFEGRPATLPAVGEPRAATARAAALGSAEAAHPRERRRHTERAASPLRWFAVAAPGTEELVLHELAELPGIDAPERVPGGVLFRGSLELGLRANLSLRCASRVWATVGEVDAREFAMLRRRVAVLPWERYVARGAPISVKASASRCRLYHTEAIGENVALGIADRLARRSRGARPAARSASGDASASAGAPSEVLVLARGERDRFTLRVDASGALLHQRGWRSEAGAAPLRETLASALLAAADWDPATPLVDPLCGSGTLAIEAALLALERVPGAERSYALEAWPCADGELAQRVRAELATASAQAEARADALGGPIAFGFDRDPAAIEIAQRNAARAGVERYVQFSVSELAELRAPRGRGRGLVLANPPYGRRLGDARGARATYAKLGWILKERFARWRAAILVPSPQLGAALRIEPVSKQRLAHGGLRVELQHFEL
jgi:putative N6-adenine-specific DNA methylase